MAIREHGRHCTVNRNAHATISAIETESSGLLWRTQEWGEVEMWIALHVSPPGKLPEILVPTELDEISGKKNSLRYNY